MSCMSDIFARSSENLKAAHTNFLTRDIYTRCISQQQSVRRNGLFTCSIMYSKLLSLLERGSSIASWVRTYGVPRYIHRSVSGIASAVGIIVEVRTRMCLAFLEFSSAGLKQIRFASRMILETDPVFVEMALECITGIKRG